MRDLDKDHKRVWSFMATISMLRLYTSELGIDLRDYWGTHGQ